LACAMEAKRAGMRALVIDKGCLCNSIYNYPVNMVFFTTPELLEIGGLPMVTGGDKPTRIEALKYYRKGAEHYGLELRLFEKVLRVDGNDGAFTVVTETESGREEKYHTKKIVVATGYYDLPNEMGVPGEHLPHVTHYYTEPHPFWHQDVVVIGGKNSAVESALDLYRNGARVTLLVRSKELGASLKYWVRPDIENRIKELHALHIGRTSCSRFWANQFRVLLTAAAYVLMQELRLRAAGTRCARAQVWTLRERLLKLGARVAVSARRMVLHLPASFPFLADFRKVAMALGACTA